MLHIPKIDDYLKILTDEEVISEYFKSIREEQNLRKVAKSLYLFLITPNEVKNMCNQTLQIILYISIMLRF